MSGNTGCNDYTAGYTATGDTLTIGAAAVTRRACGPAETLVETAYLAALPKVTTYSIDGDALDLKTTEGAVGLHFVATEPASLTGERWVATGVNNGSGGVASMVTGTTLTAIFASEGTVAGSGGCNDFHGSYTTNGAGIKIGPLAATKKACADPAGVDTQEAQYFAALQNATTYTITGTKLELRDAGGALQVAFQPTLGNP